MTTLHEECGIAAVYQLDQATAPPVNVTAYIPGMLLDLQNRGQLSAGVTSYNPKRERLLQTHKDLGNVGQAFKMYHSSKAQRLVETFSGTAAIGHVRYATSGLEDYNFAQPFERVHGKKWKWFSIAFNGNLANFETLKAQLIEKGYHITYNTDTEVMMHYINKELIGEEPRGYLEIFSALAKAFDGAFNIAFINGMGDMVVMRDPRGIKPLCYGIKGNLLFAASESVALTRLGIMDYTDLEPGTMLIATKEGYRIERFHEEVQHARCYFEWVYFSNLASNLDGRSVYKARRALGEQLADIEDIPPGDDVLIVPVPETSTVAAVACGFKLGIPVMEGLVRNRYVGRTFIEGETRQSLILKKFTPIPEILENKRILLVDDSLVRAVTLKTIIQDLYNRGRVAEVHVRIACPPILAPCFYGIDIPTVKELFATSYWKPGEPLELSPEVLLEMARKMGANSLKFLTIPRLAESIGFTDKDLCLACVNGEYPTPWGRYNYQKQLQDYKAGK
ncbi:MAG: amidophosphoribosyltransferase [SAR324 cluster bacterium]|nr:amidophosphoribosyltransferase [SAR324 cluster bacterium]